MTRRRLLALAAVLVGAWASWRFWYVPHLEANVEACASCLPKGLTLSTEFSDSGQTIPSTGKRRVVTVHQKLFQIGAHCENGVIYDRWGRRVFFHPMRERGTIPGNPDMLRKIQEQDRQDLEELRRQEAQGTVIRMYETHKPV
jgi:hypothetical protein